MNSTENTLQALQGSNYTPAVNAFIESQYNVVESTRQTYRRALSQFFLFLKVSGATGAVTRQTVADYKAALLKGIQDGKYSALTVCSYINAVRLFFAWTESENIYCNVAKGIKAPKHTATHRKQHLEKEKAAELLQHYATAEEATALRNYAIVNLLLRTGIRTAELTTANINDIAFLGNTRVLYIKGKGHTEKDSYVILTEKTYNPIRKYLATRVYRPGDPLFISTSNHHAKSDGGTTDRLTTRTVRAIVKEGLKAVNLDGKEFTAHSLRHTTAVMILEAGGVLDDVQAQLRHASTATSMIYVQSYNKEKQLKNINSALDSAF